MEIKNIFFENVRDMDARLEELENCNSFQEYAYAVKNQKLGFYVNHFDLVVDGIPYSILRDGVPCGGADKCLAYLYGKAAQRAIDKDHVVIEIDDNGNYNMVEMRVVFGNGDAMATSEDILKMYDFDCSDISDLMGVMNSFYEHKAEDYSLMFGQSYPVSQIVNMDTMVSRINRCLNVGKPVVQLLEDESAAYGDGVVAILDYVPVY
jgi:hypothetical protein